LPESETALVQNATPPPHSRVLFRVASALALLLALGWLYGSRPAPVNDFAAYWTAARLLLAHQDPYAEPPVRHIEESLGHPDSKHMLMLNPPWTLAVVLPFGLLPYRVGQILWVWLELLLVLASARTLWRLYKERDQPPLLLWLAIGVFAPLYIVLAIGQITPLVLFGVSNFLCMQAKRKDVLAGLCLFLVALKPHLAFLLWLAVVLWILREARWRIAASLAVAMIAAAGIALFFDPQAFQQYAAMWAGTVMVWRETPTLGGLLCRLPHAPQWLAFAPAVAAVVWFVFDRLRWRQHWNWAQRAPMLLLLSVVASPYAWLFDQIILLPAVAQIAADKSAGARRKRRALGLLYVAMNLSLLTWIGPGRSIFWYAWTAPAWLLLYVGARRGVDTPT
jgi:Glycosyltransferase family 87